MTDEQLRGCYKFYKQATCGDRGIRSPSIFDIKGCVKWNSWNSVKGMNRKDAMLKYCEIVLSL